MNKSRLGPFFLASILVASFLAVAAVPGRGPDPDVAPGPATDPPPDKAAVAETRTYLERLEKLGFAGVVLVARGNAPLLAEGYGLADRESGLRWSPATLSNLGSITKQFTGAAILALEEEKKLSVTDAITRYFDEVPPDKAGITLHHLLTHSSGLGDPGTSTIMTRCRSRNSSAGSCAASSVRARGRIRVCQLQFQPSRGDHREAHGPELRVLSPRAPFPARRHV